MILNIQISIYYLLKGVKMYAFETYLHDGNNFSPHEAIFKLNIPM